MVLKSELAQVLHSSQKRLAVSRVLRDRSQELLLRTHHALHASQRVLAGDPVTVGPRWEPKTQEQPPVALTTTAAAQLPDVMEVVSGRTLENELVPMDGKHFVSCSLINCTLQYEGHPVVIESTTFHGCRFKFLGDAALTTQFLECFGLLPAGDALASAPAPSASQMRPN